MTNAPTNSAIPPKTSSAVRKKPKSSSRSAACAAASCSPVRTATGWPRSAARTRPLSRGGATPSSAAIEIALSLPSSPASACAVGSVAIAIGRPAIDDTSPKRAAPVSVRLRAPSLPTIFTRWPTL